MRFYFSEEDHSTEVRARDIRAALAFAHHQVIHGQPQRPAPAGADVWMYGIGIAGTPPICPQIAQALLNTKAEIVLFQLCDHPSFRFEQVPAGVADRTRLFLRNHWPSSEQSVPSGFRTHIGYLPPRIKPMAARPGRELAKRLPRVVFYGTRTGLDNLGSGRNAREDCVRLLRASEVRFEGGITGHEDPRYKADPKLLVPRIGKKLHQSTLADSAICLAPWGNHPITYRLFEGLAARCLVLAQSLSSTRFIDGALIAGRHYVEIAADLSDLVEKANYYLSHLHEAQRIADEGHNHYLAHFAGRGRLISEFLFNETTKSWGDLYSPAPKISLISTLRSLDVRLFSKRA